MANDNLKAKLAEYEAAYAKNCEKVPARQNLPEQPVYTPLDLEGFDYERDLGFPGFYPYTRGVQPTMYRGRFWTMRMYAGFATAEESNKRYRYLIESGATGLSCAFDLPTQIGYDSDDAMAEGEVGKVGVAIDSLKDMEILFQGIDLGKVSTSMTINAPASVLLAMYIAVAEKQGVPSTELRGTIQNDILKEYAARGTYIFPPKPSMRLITNIFEYCSQYVPKWNTISISGYHIREAGSTAAQEIAFTIADGIAYIEAALKAGLEVDDFAGRLSFFWNAHNNVLEEVAKFRASRRLWAHILKERFGAKKPKSMMLRVHTQTAGSMLTAQQVDDPLGGSYYVEAMTNAIYEEAKAYIQKIDEMGGAVEAIEKGYIQKEIQESAYKWQMEVESGLRTIVGVNKFQVEEKPVEGLLRIDASVGINQSKKTQQVRADRDQAAVDAALAALKAGAEDESVNLMPLILAAVKTYATLGEICNVLRGVFGEYQAHSTL